jgi:hypothetical protein
MAKRKAILRSDYTDTKPKKTKKGAIAEPAVDAVGEGFKPLWTEPQSYVNNELLTLKQEFDNDLEYWKPDRLRFARNGSMYWGTDYGQWNGAIVQRLLNEGREPFQANIAAEKVETILAQTMQNPFDMTFKPSQQIN